MKTPAIYLSVNALIACITLLCGQDQTYTTSVIQKIVSDGLSDVQYYHHDKAYAEISGDINRIQYKDNTLFIHNGKVIIKSNNQNIQSIQSDGMSKIHIYSPITNDNISFEIDGTSDIKANLQNKNTKIKIDGAATIQLFGNTDSLFIFSDGVSSVKTQNLIAKKVKVQADGVSSIAVFPDSSINGSINGNSSLKIYGNPKSINVEKKSPSSTIKYKTISSTDTSSSSKKWYYRWKLSSQNKSWQGLAFGINGYLSESNNISLPVSSNYLELDYARCFNFQLNLSQNNIYFYKRNIALATGFGFEWKRFAFDHNVNLNPDSSFTYGVIDSSKAFTYKKNLLKAVYLQIPLLIEFHFGKKDKINIDAGIIGQIKLNSRTRQIREKNNFIYEITRNDSYNLNPFLAKYYFSIGIDNFSLFAEYTFTPLFQKNKGSILYPFNLGLKWNIF